MFIIKNKKIFISISVILVSLSLLSLIFFGLNFGIDFKGGSLLEVEYTTDRPSQSEIDEILKPLEFGTILVQPMGEKGYSLKARHMTDTEKVQVLGALGESATEISFTSIGPSVGEELARKSIISFILVSLGIILWVAYSFRKVSKPVSSWKYGFIAVIAVVHDVIIASGVFAVISHLTGAEVDTLFVVAILTVLGLSVSDTIVVFDRIRENIRLSHTKLFEEIVGKSISQVYTRSIATSLTVILALLALIFFGPQSTKMFSIVMAVGMFFGTYSSIFLASPLLVMTNNLQKGTPTKGKK
jgi:preprotein translocase subunit SecF